MMKIFTKQQSIALTIILLSLFTISFFNFKTALRRGRDNERENDLGDLSKMLDAYKEKNSNYPPDLSYLTNAPKDPATPQGYSYFYVTDGKYFQLYASLEGGSDESLYNPVVQNLGLKCGKYICNFGKSSGNIPLDKSIEVYENEIRDAQKKQTK